MYTIQQKLQIYQTVQNAKFEILKKLELRTEKEEKESQDFLQMSCFRVLFFRFVWFRFSRVVAVIFTTIVTSTIQKI